MDAGDNLAPRQLAAVADVLLPWLRADADSDSPTGALLGARDLHALEDAAEYGNGATLVPALRALLARAEVARTAANLMLTSKEVCEAVCARNADIIGAAGATCCTHAAGMCDMLRELGASGGLISVDEAMCSRDSAGLFA